MSHHHLSGHRSRQHRVDRTDLASAWPRRVIAATASLAIAGAVAACGDEATDPDGTDLAVGTFVLEAIDGELLPAPARSRFQSQDAIVADTLILTESGTFDETAIPEDDMPVFGLSGSGRLEGDSIFLIEPILGSVAARGVVDAAEIAFRTTTSHHFPDYDWTYVLAR